MPTVVVNAMDVAGWFETENESADLDEIRKAFGKVSKYTVNLRDVVVHC